MTRSTFEGGCSYGNVRFRVQGDATNLCYCHCQSCRRACAAPFVAWGTFERSLLQVTFGTLALHRSSPGVLRGFCSSCGTPLTYEHESRHGEMDETLALLDDPRMLRPANQIWVSHRLPWVVLGDGLPQYAEWRVADS